MLLPFLNEYNTGYEPIIRPSSHEGLWIGQLMANLGYNGYYQTAVRQYVQQRRLDLSRDWAFAIFVVNSEADSDGSFSNGRFAYAYLHGPFMVMTYDNVGWGISRLGLVTAHEMGHIFGALDEHITSACTDTETGGYLAVANTNCENGDPPTEDSIMRGGSSLQTSYLAHLASTPVRGQVGWRDSDGDGLYDVVDTDVTLSATFVSADAAGQPGRYDGVATDMPYDSPARPDSSINTIAAVEYRLDEGAWLPASAGDGSFDTYGEAFSLTLPTLSSGIHTVQIRARNSVGNYGPLFNDTIVVLAAPSGVLASDGAYFDRVRITWRPVSEASSYSVYRAVPLSGQKLLIGSVTTAGYFDDLTVEVHQTYSYFVTASNSYGSSGDSLADTGYVIPVYWMYLPIVTSKD